MNQELKLEGKVTRPDASGICRAIDVVGRGGVAILPGDTMYGFFASALQRDAVERVYEIKNRERRKPFVIYTDATKVDDIAHVNAVARELIDKFWPKPLSLILPRRSTIPAWFTNNQNTIAVLTARNPVIASIVSAVKEPVFATSCNVSGEPALTTAAEVSVFIDKVDLIIEDDSVPIYNCPSTMVDCTIYPPRIARLSSLSFEEIQNVIPEITIDFGRCLS